MVAARPYFMSIWRNNQFHIVQMTGERHLLLGGVEIIDDGPGPSPESQLPPLNPAIQSREPTPQEVVDIEAKLVKLNGPRVDDSPPLPHPGDQ